MQVLIYLYNHLSPVEHRLPGTSNPLKALNKMFGFILSLPSHLALPTLVTPIKETLTPNAILLKPHISNAHMLSFAP